MKVGLGYEQLEEKKGLTQMMGLDFNYAKKWEKFR